MDDHRDRIPGLAFAIKEIEQLRRGREGLYSAAYIAAYDDILVTLRADLEREGEPSTSELMSTTNG